MLPDQFRIDDALPIMRFCPLGSPGGKSAGLAFRIIPKHGSHFECRSGEGLEVKPTFRTWFEMSEVNHGIRRVQFRIGFALWQRAYLGSVYL